MYFYLNIYIIFDNISDFMSSYNLYFVDMYLVGHRQNPHSNQDTQISIESYHAALKRWMKINNHQLQGCRMDFLCGV
jgi:hypothetical protein